MDELAARLDSEHRITALHCAQALSDDTEDIIKTARKFYAFLREPELDRRESE